MKNPNGAITLSVKIIPNAGKNQVVGWENGFLKIRIQAPPEKGKANQELINYLSSLLDLPKSSITLLRGETSRKKLLLIEGITHEELINRMSGSL